MRRMFFLLIVFILFLQSCSIIKKSDKHVKSFSYKLSNDITITHTGIVNLFSLEFIPFSFRIDYKDKIIYVDPFLVSDIKPADYILITHSHADHFSPSDIKKLIKKDTKIICPKTVQKNILEESILVKPDDILEFDNIKIEAIQSYNTKKGFLGLIAHPKSDLNTGFVIDLDGIRLYYTGDTDFIPEMKNLKNITLALVPLGGDNLTMNYKDGALAINTIKPLIVIPIHYEIGKNIAKNFSNLVDKDIKVEIIEE
ncbi:MAG: hypothetical protein A2086_00635 [Spirochaetes bacterium GWD1_27_9]|nr:MAG: hypothetical protein A2Z98_05145 [Spirochaetes bacterium GWB1_27_13]OHD21716.1 MAG: hypothetical protein A2Y34_08435 [Spirochaetes bacterium GWC1_27_15]OHD32516.1 MAG: hypothetical protein A2086_00635 [Spirochaetes bacterium GWD1_27_9]